MAVWQFMKAGAPINGRLKQPGDPTFSSADVTAMVAASSGAADDFNYVGTFEVRNI